MSARSRNRGTVLIVAMLIVFAVASLTLTMGRTARTELLASANDLAAIEASAVERGAEQYVLSLLTDQFDMLDQYTEQDFAAVPVGSGYFWVVRPDYGDSTLPLYGLVDETAKLDINAASSEQLRMMPQMTDEIAASIVDWRDGDDNVTAAGAESGQYLSQSEPYNAKNAPFETVEELMLVRGMTRELLYGQRNLAANRSSSLANDVVLRNGWYDYFTIYSSMPNRATDGSNRINISNMNSQRRSQLRTLLRNQLGEVRGNEVDGKTQNRNADIFAFARNADLTMDELALLEDYITTGGANTPLVGKININQAPREVLECLPELDPSEVDSLLARRPSAVQTHPFSIAWVYDVLEEKAIGLGNVLCGRGRQYSADIVALSGNGRAFKRVRIVVNAGVTPPRIVYRRDITERGFPLDASVRQSLREGHGVGNWNNGFGGMR